MPGKLTVVTAVSLSPAVALRRKLPLPVERKYWVLLALS